MDDMRVRIEQELARVRQERTAFITHAERQVAAFDGAIAALEQLLKPKQEQEPEPANARHGKQRLPGAVAETNQT